MNKIYAHLHRVETFTKFLLCKPCVFSDRRHRRIVYIVKGLLIFNGIGGAFFFPLSYIRFLHRRVHRMPYEMCVCISSKQWQNTFHTPIEEEREPSTPFLWLVKSQQAAKTEPHREIDRRRDRQAYTTNKWN